MKTSETFIFPNLLNKQNTRIQIQYACVDLENL